VQLQNNEEKKIITLKFEKRNYTFPICNTNLLYSVFFLQGGKRRTSTSLKFNFFPDELFILNRLYNEEFTKSINLTLIFGVAYPSPYFFFLLINYLLLVMLYTRRVVETSLKNCKLCVGTRHRMAQAFLSYF